MYASKCYPKTTKQTIRQCIACLLLAVTVFAVSACGSAAENITSEADIIQYLTKTFGQKEYSICDTVEHEKYKVTTFTYDGGKLGYAFLRKSQGDGYDAFKADLQDGDSSYHNGIVWQLIPWEQQLLLLLASDGKARTALVYKDNEEIERFRLDKGKNTAYIFSIADSGDADTSFSLTFKDENGRDVGN